MRFLLVIISAICLILGCSKQPEQIQAKTYEVVITGNPDGEMIKGIKGIREVTGLGLAEAKDLFDNMPSAVKSDLSKNEAEAVVEKLRASHLTVEINEK